jgi:C4-dicarboxylate-specific signal transduction histidine kinase
VIQVRDNGGGIAPGIMERIFDPFFTTKEVTKGTGLGLSISYGIVSAMGGRLTAANVDGGALFTLHLPVADIAKAPGL